MLNTYVIVTAWFVLTVAAVYRFIVALRHRTPIQQQWSVVRTWTIGVLWIAITAHVLLMHSEHISRLHMDNMLWLVSVDLPMNRVTIWEPPSPKKGSEGIRHAVITIAGGSEEDRELHVQLGTPMYRIGNYGRVPPSNWDTGLSQRVLQAWVRSQCPGAKENVVDELANALLSVVDGLKQNERISEASPGNVTSIRKEEVILERRIVGLLPFSPEEVVSWFVVWVLGYVYYRRRKRDISNY